MRVTSHKRASTDKHRAQVLLGVWAEAAYTRLLTRVLECSEQHVPYGQVREVVAMASALVMHAVTLRALDQVPKPVRGPDVPVIEQLSDPRKEEGKTCTFRIQAEKEVEDYIAHYHGERNHQGLGNRLLMPVEHIGRQSSSVKKHERLGGMLNYYDRRTA